MTRAINPANVIGRAISRGKVPHRAAMLPTPLDFSLDTTITCSINALNDIRNVAGIDGIQSAFIDNSNNGSTVSITLDNGVTYTCPAFAQAVFPIFWSGQQINFSATSQGGVLVKVFWLNTREAAQIWSAKIPIAGVINVTGSTIFSQPQAGTFIDGSFALAAGNQQVLAANGNRQLLAMRNPATAASQAIAAPEPVYVNFGGAAAVNGLSSWELLPGESLPEFLMVTTQAVDIACATNGHQICIKTM